VEFSQIDLGSPMQSEVETDVNGRKLIIELSGQMFAKRKLLKFGNKLVDDLLSSIMLNSGPNNKGKAKLQNSLEDFETGLPEEIVEDENRDFDESENSDDESTNASVNSAKNQKLNILAMEADKVVWGLFKAAALANQNATSKILTDDQPVEPVIQNSMQMKNSKYKRHSKHAPVIDSMRGGIKHPENYFLQNAQVSIQKTLLQKINGKEINGKEEEKSIDHLMSDDIEIELQRTNEFAPIPSELPTYLSTPITPRIEGTSSQTNLSPSNIIRQIASAVEIVSKFDPEMLEDGLLLTPENITKLKSQPQTPFAHLQNTPTMLDHLPSEEIYVNYKEMNLEGIDKRSEAEFVSNFYYDRPIFVGHTIEYENSESYHRIAFPIEIQERRKSPGQKLDPIEFVEEQISVERENEKEEGRIIQEPIEKQDFKEDFKETFPVSTKIPEQTIQNSMGFVKKTTQKVPLLSTTAINHGIKKEASQNNLKQKQKSKKRVLLTLETRVRKTQQDNINGTKAVLTKNGPISGSKDVLSSKLDPGKKLLSLDNIQIAGQTAKRTSVSDSSSDIVSKLSDEDLSQPTERATAKQNHILEKLDELPELDEGAQAIANTSWIPDFKVTFPLNVGKTSKYSLYLGIYS
jgi:hypothetical protein